MRGFVLTYRKLSMLLVRMCTLNILYFTRLCNLVNSSVSMARDAKCFIMALASLNSVRQERLYQMFYGVFVMFWTFSDSFRKGLPSKTFKVQIFAAIILRLMFSGCINLINLALLRVHYMYDVLLVWTVIGYFWWDGIESVTLYPPC